jgi:hypothetical protein
MILKYQLGDIHESNKIMTNFAPISSRVSTYNYPALIPSAEQ